MAEQTDDPFAPSEGVLPRLAQRLGCSEGQLYTMTIGVLLTTAVWTNALPNVVWRYTPAVPPPSAPALVAAAPEAPMEPPASEGALPAGFAPAPDPLEADPVTAPATASAGSSLTPADPPPQAVGPAPASPASPEPSASAAPAAPFRVLAAGWASRYAGTPLATLGVPDRSVPVGARGASSESIAYLAVTGTTSRLVLEVDPDGANRLPELAALRLCPVPRPAAVGRGATALEDAPPPDCTRSVDGVRSDDGAAWSFDLAGLGPATALALGPAAGPTAPDFQVVLRVPTAG